MPTQTLPPNKYLIGMIDMNELLRLLTHEGYQDVILNKFNDKRYRLEIVSIYYKWIVCLYLNLIDFLFVCL